jgi:hypothetical protein
MSLRSRQTITDLIITVPAEHGFSKPYSMPAHTKMLAFHSHLPLMGGLQRGYSPKLNTSHNGHFSPTPNAFGDILK